MGQPSLKEDNERLESNFRFRRDASMGWQQRALSMLLVPAHTWLINAAAIASARVSKCA
ncbi:hypothetical protein QR685DRAFT_572327 [Neurospora intermedia]|uniref:Uncharacterized protein n=1 Tax=Neurospora intermedia TaxID=5142 RepID=A0ABR3D9D5_NEUIN